MLRVKNHEVCRHLLPHHDNYEGVIFLLFSGLPLCGLFMIFSSALDPLTQLLVSLHEVLLLSNNFFCPDPNFLYFFLPAFSLLLGFPLEFPKFLLTIS